MQDMSTQQYFFGDFRTYNDEIEKVAAKVHLCKWKQFILESYPEFKFIEEQFIDRDYCTNMKGDFFKCKPTIALKICLEGPKDFEFKKEGAPL